MRRWALPSHAHLRKNIGVRVVGAVGVGLLAWWVTGLEPFSAGATVAVLGSGAAAVAVGLRDRTARSVARPSRRAVAVWVALVAALAAWQLAAYRQSPRSEHPTLSSLTNAALDPRPVRALVFVAWLVVAAHLARR
jgi:hypothetical protein